MSSGEQIWRNDGLSNLVVNFAYKSNDGGVLGSVEKGTGMGDWREVGAVDYSPIFVHRIAGTRDQLPDLSMIPIFVFPEVCKTKSIIERRLLKFPSSLNDLMVQASGCGLPHASILLVSLESGDVVIPSTWGAAVRWLRERAKIPSAIMLREFDKKNHRFYPRTMPTCIFSWNDKEHDLILGTPWNSGYGGNSIDSILAFHTSDLDLSSQRSETIKLCLAKDDKSFSVHRDSDCQGNDKKFVAFPSSGPGRSICVGHSDELKSDRFEVATNCTRESYVHSFAFHEATLTEKRLFTRLKADDNSELWAVGASETVPFQTHKLCISSTEPFEYADCDSANELIVARSKQSKESWCIGKRKGSVCLRKGHCDHDCLDGVFVRSVKVHELPLSSFVFRRDANIGL